MMFLRVSAQATAYGDLGFILPFNLTIKPICLTMASPGWPLSEQTLLILR